MFWKNKQKKLEENKDYIFITFNETDITGIQLIAGDYKGVLYHYHNARVVEEGELARLQFGYTIVHPGEHDIDALTNDEKFHTIMGDLLTQIMLSKIENEQTGKNDTQKLTLQ